MGAVKSIYYHSMLLCYTRGAFVVQPDKNNDANFFSKIRKMKTKLNLWQTRDLTLFGKSVLAKTLGASQLIYTASLMTVPDAVTRAAQSLLFSSFVEK